MPVVANSFGPAALKLVSPLGDAQTELRALQALAGHGAVTVHDADVAHSALLLELLSGPTLAEQIGDGDPLHAASLAGGIAGRIAAVEAPAGALTQSDGAAMWASQLRQQHDEARLHGIAIAEDSFDTALDCVRQLGRGRRTTLTHGDLSFTNIMRHADGSWAAIDPSCLAGPREHESHTILRSTLAWIIGSTDPVTTMSDIHRSFCLAAGADESFALEISYARFVASYYWESQHRGDPRNIEELRVGMQCAEQLLREVRRR